MRKFILLLLLIPLSFSYFFDLELVRDIIVPVTLVIVAAGLGIMWMMSDMFANPQMKAQVKMDIRSVFSGMVLLVLVLFLFASSDVVVSVFSGESNVKQSAEASLSSSSDALESAYYDLVKAAHYIGMIGGFGFSQPTPIYFFSFNFVSAPHGGIRGLSPMVMQGAGAISGALFIYRAIFVLLDFFTLIVPNVILPIALALRFIPFTKKIGNSLIALSIGAAIIFPISVVLVSEFHTRALSGIDPPDLDFAPFEEFHFPAVGWFCSNSDSSIINVAKSFVNISEIGWGIIVGIACCLAFPLSCPANFVACYQLVTNVIFPLATTIWQALFWVVALIDFQAFFGSVSVDKMYDALADFLQVVTYYVVTAYLDAILIAIITIVTTKSISGAIGGESYMAGIDRFIR